MGVVTVTKTIILYSGGLDSFIGWNLLAHTRPGGNIGLVSTYFDLHTRYASKERQRFTGNIDIHDLIGMERLERPDGFLPQRNVMLVTAAAAHYPDADEIVLCGVRGEYSRDKHPQFYERMTRLLSYTAGRPVRVFSPFERMTKSQAVRAYLAAGLPRDLLFGTVSCYDAKSNACGRCMSCFRRWVALENNGMAKDETWDVPPWESTTFSSPSALRSLPKRVWWDFALAQRDVGLAYIRLRRRLHAGE